MSFRVHTQMRASRNGHAPVTLEDGEDGMVRVKDEPGVVLSTSEPVRGWDSQRGRHFLSLRHTKAALARMRKNGSLESDGSLVMLGDHGGFFGGGPKTSDRIGLWENLRIEERMRDGATENVLVGNRAFDPAMLDAWMFQNGIERGLWRGVVERNAVLTRVSIRFKPDESTVRLLDGEREGLKIYQAQLSRLPETSFVWQGADPHAGTDRSEMAMTEERLAEIVKEALREAASKTLADREARQLEMRTTQAQAARQVELDRVTAATRIAFAGLWTSMQSRAHKEMGADAPDAITAALAEDSDELRAAALSCAMGVFLAKDAAGTPPPGSRAPTPAPAGSNATLNSFDVVGDERAFDALRDQSTVFCARVADVYEKDTGKRERWASDAAAVDHNWKTAPGRTALQRFAQARGILPPGYIAENDSTMLADLQRRWVPSGAAVKELGAHWYVDPTKALYDKNGMLLAWETLTSRGASGGLTPASLPAFLLENIAKVFLIGHDSEILPPHLTRHVPMPSLDKIRHIESDVLVPWNKVSAEQDRPSGYMFDAVFELNTAIRAMTMAFGFNALFSTDGFRLFMQMAKIAHRWAGKKSKDIIDTLTAGLVASTIGATPTSAYVGEHDITSTDYGSWINRVNIQAAKERAIARPTDAPSGLTDNVHNPAEMRPDVLVYVTRTEQDWVNYIARTANANDPNTNILPLGTALWNGRVITNVYEEAITYALKGGNSEQATLWRQTLSGHQMRVRINSQHGIENHAPGIKIDIDDSQLILMPKGGTVYRHTFA